MRQEKQEGVMERSSISFGYMLRRTDYEKKLDNIVCTFLEKNDILFNNLKSKGIISIIIKSYAEDWGS